MKRLPLCVEGVYHSEHNEFVSSIQRNFQVLTLDSIRPYSVEDITHILDHGASVRELKIIDCKFKDPIYMKLCFEAMPLLEKVHFNGVMLHSDIEITPIHFKNLVKLEVIESSAKVI